MENFYNTEGKRDAAHITERGTAFYGYSGMRTGGPVCYEGDITTGERLRHKDSITPVELPEMSDDSYYDGYDDMWDSTILTFEPPVWKEMSYNKYSHKSECDRLSNEGWIGVGVWEV